MAEDVRVEREALNLATDLLKLLTDPGGDDLLVLRPVLTAIGNYL